MQLWKYFYWDLIELLLFNQTFFISGKEKLRKETRALINFPFESILSKRFENADWKYPNVIHFVTSKWMIHEANLLTLCNTEKWPSSHLSAAIHLDSNTYTLCPWHIDPKFKLSFLVIWSLTSSLSNSFEGHRLGPKRCLFTHKLWYSGGIIFFHVLASKGLLLNGWQLST